MAADIRLDRTAIRRLLSDPNGAVGRNLTLRALRVQAGARRRCPVDQGRLRSSIRWELRSGPLGLYAFVGSDVEYAHYVHDGTADHIIRPRTKKVLRFPSARARGGFAFARFVRHPGTTGVPFLRDALRDAA